MKFQIHIKMKFHVKQSAIRFYTRWVERFKKIRKSPNFKENFLKESSNNACKFTIVAANLCNTLPRPAVSNGLIAAKLKRDLKYSGHVYFHPVRPHMIINYSKSHNNF